MDSSNPAGSRRSIFQKPAIAALATGILVLGANLIGFWAEARFPHAGIWPANAILLGILATHPRANNVLTWVLSIGAYLVAAMFVVGQLGPSVLLTGLNLITVVVGLALFRLFASRVSPIVGPSGLVTLFAIMILAAGSAGVIGEIITEHDTARNWLSSIVLRSSTELVNLAIFLPLVIGGRMILGPPARKLSRDRHTLVRHGAALATLLISCALMAVMGGPGAFVFYLPALIWCATRVRSGIAFALSSAAAIWTLTTVPAGIVLLGPGDSNIATFFHMASFRLGVASVTIGAIAVVALNAFWRRTHYEQIARANYDALTGLHTRKQFYESAKFALDQLKSGSTSIAIAIDIDRFEALNETHGQPAGDRVLQTVAEVLTDNIRKGDIVGRLGIEEFAILLPGAGIEEGNRVAERMRQSIADEPFQEGAANFSTSVSIGLVEFRTPADFSRMLSLADEALYEAKAAGRNRVVAYASEPATGAA